MLGITSPTPECGKTTCLTFLGALVPRACPASNITTAALFRAVEKWQPTLLIDEADTFLKNSDELRGVLNSGHQRSNAYVIRTTGDDHEPKRFALGRQRRWHLSASCRRPCRAGPFTLSCGGRRRARVSNRCALTASTTWNHYAGKPPLGRG